MYILYIIYYILIYYILIDNSYAALLPLNGDEKPERNSNFVKIMKKSLLAKKFNLRNAIL